MVRPCKPEEVPSGGHTEKDRAGQQLRKEVQVRVQRREATMGRDNLRTVRELVEEKRL